MRVTVRLKVFLVVAAAAGALLLLVVGSSVTSAQRTRALADVEGRLVPKLELGQHLSAGFEHLRHGMQDAVAAQDLRALDGTRETRRDLFDLIAAPGVLTPAHAASLHDAIQKYDDVARDVSARMIAGETGEKLVGDISTMQDRQRAVTNLIQQLGTLNRSELAAGFASMRKANGRADRRRLVIAVTCLALLLALAYWVGRGLVRAVGELSVGFARFGGGDFTEDIPVLARDELGDVASHANEMAKSLRRLNAQRDREDWQKAGQVRLGEAMRGDLPPEALAKRALEFLIERVGAHAGAFYECDGGETLQLVAGSGLASDAPTTLLVDEGLPGRALARGEVAFVNDVPPEYFMLRSGLGEAPPRELVFVPLSQGTALAGVVELAFLTACGEPERAFLASICDSLASAVVTARSRAAQSELLRETQELAERLAQQEEELRVNNQELGAQQEELRTANEELEEQRRELGERNQELEAARARLQEKADELARVSKYKSQFLANMSHELRTPLNSMLLLSHLLADNEGGNLTEKQVLHCNTIHSAGQDLLDLINQILDLAKIEAGHQDVEWTEVRFERFVDYARRVFEPMARDKGLDFEVSVDAALPQTLITDPQRLERILANLLGNAIKFTDSGRVELQIARPATTSKFSRPDIAADLAVAFAVVDTGIGIPPEDRARVFAPFEQIESRANRRYAGTGLGLAISRESAGLLGGELQLESTQGEGSTFTLVVPLAPRTARASRAPGPDVSNTAPALDRGEPRLLVVEDDPILADELAEIVRARGLGVVVAGTGQEGLRLARTISPRGIILDVGLPDIDGWRVMEELHEDPATATIPVHFLSALDEAKRGLSLGAVGYLTKPASRAELAGMVRTLTRRSDSPQRVLVVEDNVDDGEAVVELLRREHLETRHVTSAAAAIGALDTERFGCIILDLGLPDMDGLAVIESLVEKNPDPPPILVHTGRALTRKETRQLEAYAKAVILKDGSSSQRLMDEVRLFLGHVADRSTDLKPVETQDHADSSLVGATVLVAEDDMRTAYALSALLQGKGAEVVIAETGREALEQLDQRPVIDCVLMDVMMPEMDGYEAMRGIRRDPRFRDLPVIALTAKAMKGERERCLECGASDYLTKPVDSTRLLATLRTWMGKGAAE